MPTDPRLELLAGYLEQFRTRYATLAPDEHVEVDEGAIAVSPWVAARVAAFATTDDDPIDRVVAHGVALMLRCKLDLARLHAATETRQLFVVQGELMLDVAVGSSMAREVQKHIDAMLAAGRVADSRDLSAFQHELRNAVSRTRTSIGESERQRAAAISEEMDRHGTPEADEAAELPSAERRRSVRRPRVRQVPVVLAPPPQRKAPFGVASLLALMFFVLAGTAWYLGTQRGVEPEAAATAAVATGDQLAMRAEVTRVQDRHPHVVVTVEESFWEARDPEARLQWARELSRDAARGGYQGLVVREPRGRPLAEWVRGGETRLMPDGTR